MHSSQQCRCLNEDFFMDCELKSGFLVLGFHVACGSVSGFGPFFLVFGTRPQCAARVWVRVDDCRSPRSQNFHRIE